MSKSKKLGLIFGVLLATVLMISTGIAQSAQQEKPKDPGTQMTPQTVTIDGKVSAVSETSVTIVDSKKVEKTIVIDGTTKITKSGKVATPADIKADDTVVVVAKAEGDALTAISIKVV